MGNLVKKVAQLTGLAAILLVAGQVHATKYKIKSVITSNDYGFRTSLLHEATVQNNRSGGILDWLISASGTYDSHTGLLDVWFGTKSGGKVHLKGNLHFNDQGYLTGRYNTVLTTDTDYRGGRKADAYNFLFKGNGSASGLECNCGPYSPNTLKPHEHGLLLTLWGYGKSQHSHYHNGKDVRRLLGTDIKIKLAEVPLPGALLFFGTALAGLVGLRRRRATA